MRAALLNLLYRLLGSNGFQWLYALLLNLSFWLGFLLKKGLIATGANTLFWMLVSPFVIRFVICLIASIPYGARCYRANAHWHEHEHRRSHRLGE